MTNDQESRGNPEDLGQDPYVERRRPDPSQPPEPVRILEGFLGDSDREGYKRLYFNREHFQECTIMEHRRTPSVATFTWTVD